MVKKVLLSNLFELNVIGGQITSRVEAKDISEKYETMKVLIPKAISNGRVNHDELGSIDVKLDVDPKRITTEGDIVIKLSTPYDACIISKDDEGLLVPSFCAIINNVPEEINKLYFLAFVNSQACKIQIRDIVSGSLTAILSTGQLKKISIPIPDSEVQNELANKYEKYIEKINLLEKIVKLESEYLDSRFLEMEV